MSKALYAERKTLVDENRKILDTADKAARVLTAEERQEMDKRDTRIEEISDHLDAVERQRKVEALLDQPEELAASPTPPPKRSEPTSASPLVYAHPLNPQGRSRTIAFSGPTSTPDYNRAFNEWLATGNPSRMAALQQDSPADGGFTVAPQQFVANLIKAVDNMVLIRQLATVYTLVGADSLGAPSLDTDAEDATWTSEIGSADEETTIVFGKREFKPNGLAKLLKVSRKLMRNSAIPMESFVAERLGYKHAIAQENAFMTGTGAQQPLGLFTASADGINTDRDTNVDATAGVIDNPDAFFTAFETLKEPYQRNSSWITHRTFRGQLRKLKSTTGEYLWQESLRDGSPSTILGRPVYASEYAPSTVAASSYCAIVGDFSYYWIVDSLNFELQRLNEAYAATNQVGFIGRAECDGMPVLAEAFARVKTDAS